MAKTKPSLIVGETRIRDIDGFCGTVAYVGPVASAKKSDEVYAGIIWDDPSRGKHDGSVICRKTNELVRHFSCEGVTQGSFLRLHKLDNGVSLNAELLRSKYVEMQAPVVAPNNLLPHTARTSRGNAKPIEFLGEMQIRERQQLKDMDKISLRREGISRVRNDDEDLVEFRHLKEMDLAGNLISNWETVFSILYQFPNLECLSLASNRIRNLTGSLVENTPTFDRMRILNLHSCSIDTFCTIQSIGRAMPYLEELCVAYSNLADMESVELQPGVLSHLKTLDCSSCQVSSWQTVSKHFSRLENLQHLSLNDNPIPSIGPTIGLENDGETPTTYFPSLVALQIAGTSIAYWSDLEGINGSLRTVKSLRLKNTPLTANMGQGEARSISIARFPALDYLNASVISTQERTEAERRYVTLVTRLLAKKAECDGEARDGLVAENPQYATLRVKYKDMTILSQSSSQAAGGSNLAASVCNVTIRSLAASSCDMEPLVRRLPGTLKVGRLKALCARAFGLDVDLMSLHFRTEVDAFPNELEDDDNALDFYGVCDGAEILMNEIDVEGQRQQAIRQAEAQEVKIREQERDISVKKELQKLQLHGSIQRAPAPIVSP